MDQVLSQEEIDALLNAMNTGEISEDTIEEEKNDAPKVREYDFRRPTRLSKEYINTLHMIFEDFSKMTGNVLSTQLRTNVSVDLAAIEQISYDEFMHSIPRVTLLGMFHSEPLKGTQLLEINPQLCSLMVELLCGGLDVRTQHPDEKIPSLESFSDIDLALMRELFKEIVNVYKTSWKDIVELNSKFDTIDTNPQISQAMSPNEPVVLVTFTVKVFGISTFINLCIPYVFFEGILDKLSIRNWFDSSSDDNEDDSLEIKRGLNNVEMVIETKLGDAQMSFADFLNLEAGDVIRLDKKTTSPLETYIEGEPFFYVKPGQKDGQLAIELLDKMEGEEDQ